MTTSLKAQLEISADASGVEAGIGKAKRSLADLGATARAAGADAADGLSKAGEGVVLLPRLAQRYRGLGTL